MYKLSATSSCYPIYPCSYEEAIEELSAMVGTRVNVSVERADGSLLLRCSGVLHPALPALDRDRSLRLAVGTERAGEFEIKPERVRGAEQAPGYVDIDFGEVRLVVERRHFARGEGDRR
jgi:hypothetical protein